VFPAALRDTLLRAAAAGLYRPHWSDEILEEVRRNLVDQGRTTEQQARRLVDVIAKYFPEARVTGYQALVDRMTNHPKDRHVLAAAVTAKAEVIITSNLADFPSGALAPYGIEARSPDAFLQDLFDREAALMAEIIQQQAADLRNPAKTVEDVLRAIALHAPSFADGVRRALGAGAA
jgi:polyhydroxyalkanoate synthesis regulator phasin